LVVLCPRLEEWILKAVGEANLLALENRKMDADEIKYWVGFSLILGIGRAKVSLLENYFSELRRAWFASANEMRAAGLDAKSVECILTTRPRISLGAELEKLERYKVKAITWNDPAYPPRLKEIDDGPPCSGAKPRGLCHSGEHLLPYKQGYQCSHSGRGEASSQLC
jgi:hypothetical protein